MYNYPRRIGYYSQVYNNGLMSIFGLIQADPMESYDTAVPQPTSQRRVRCPLETRHCIIHVEAMRT